MQVVNPTLPDLRPRYEFSLRAGALVRTATAGRLVHETELAGVFDPNVALPEQWDRAWLEGGTVHRRSCGSRAIRVLDLFCGGGGLAFGVCEAIRAVGLRPTIAAAFDVDSEALEIYERNLPCEFVSPLDVGSAIDFHVMGRGQGAQFADRPTIVERKLAARLSPVDLVIAGPPCQGHSNLNNRTRREDPRNLYYLAVPAFAMATGANAVIIENVPDVLSDRQSVVSTAESLLRSAGYGFIIKGVVSALDFGVPQTRRRFFMVALRGPSVSLDLGDVLHGLRQPTRSVEFAIDGLLSSVGASEFDSPSKLSAENQKRVSLLHENDWDDLPNEERPKCHQSDHTYQSVYGRMKKGEPSGTITTGFLTPGRGRFVHPTQKRGLTPHEGARIQGFPDGFRFEKGDGTMPSRKTLCKVIGDAVPPRLGEVVTLAALAAESVIADLPCDSAGPIDGTMRRSA